MKALRNKMPTEQYLDTVGAGAAKGREEKREPRKEERRPEPRPERREPPREEKVKPAEHKLSPELQEYAGVLSSLRGSTKAQLLSDGKGKPKEVPVRDLANVLQKEGKGLKAVVFDGIITQRILDIASDNGVEYVIGVKTGNVVKQPSKVQVLTADDLKVK
jgi:hypothetical protein